MTEDPLVDRAATFWKKLAGSNNYPPIGPVSLQKSFDSPVVTQSYQSLLQSAPDAQATARLLAIVTPHASDWLKVIPSSSLGTRLDNESMRFAVGIRLGAAVCSSFTCACGNLVDTRGTHVLSCVKSAGRQSRHSAVNDLVLRAFTRASIPAVREPSGLIPGLALRPDGATIVPWSQGRCLTWDVTCPDTLAPSSLAGTSNTAGAAAEHASTMKRRKYQQITASHSFVPVAMETLGPINEDGLLMLNSLGGRIISRTGDTRERMYLFQRLSVAVQQGNVACFVAAQNEDLFFNDPNMP